MVSFKHALSYSHLSHQLACRIRESAAGICLVMLLKIIVETVWISRINMYWKNWHFRHYFYILFFKSAFILISSTILIREVLWLQLAQLKCYCVDKTCPQTDRHVNNWQSTQNCSSLYCPGPNFATMTHIHRHAFVVDNRPQTNSPNPLVTEYQAQHY